MNVKLTMALGVALIAASTSFAQASEYQDFSNFVSTKSRAEVVAEVAAARANGEMLEVRNTSYPATAKSSVSRKDRQEVLAELTTARANGETQEVRNTTYPVTAQSSDTPKSRQEVLAELAEFRAEHPNFNTDLDYPTAFQSTPMQRRMANAQTTSMAQ